MRRDLERRLRQIEATDVWSDRIEIWVDQGDGTVCGPRGEQMTFEEAEALGRAAGKCIVFFTEMDFQL